MSFDLKVKKENYAKVVSELQEIAKVVKVEERAFSGEEKEKVDRLQTEERSLREEIDTLNRLAGVDDLRIVTDEVKQVQPSLRTEQPKDYDMALRGWLLNSAGQPMDDELRTAAARSNINLSRPNFEIRQQSTVAAEGGHLKRPQDLGGIINVLKSFGGMREVSTVLSRSKGNELKYPVLNDTANKAGIIAELAAFTNTNLTFGEVKLNVVGLRSAVFPVSVEILQDSEFPLQTVINQALSTRLARAINGLATSSAAFKGIVDGLTADAYEYDDAALTYADLVQMQGKLELAYQPNARWMFNTAVLQEIQLMVDSTGQPLWRPDLIGGLPGTILGKPYTVNDDLADADTIIYGDIREGYVMLEVGSPELITLNELYRISNNAIGVAIFHRMGGGVVNPTAIKMFNRASA